MEPVEPVENDLCIINYLVKSKDIYPAWHLEYFLHANNNDMKKLKH